MHECFINKAKYFRYLFHLLCVKFFNDLSDVHQPQTNSSDNFSRDCHPLFLLLFDPLHHRFEDECL